MSSLGAKYIALDITTATDPLTNPKTSTGSNYGNFVEAFRDAGGSTVAANLATETRITYAFANSFSIRNIEVIAESDASVTGSLYMIFAPADLNREFVTQIPLSQIAKGPYCIKLDPPYFLEDVSDKLKVRFIFKGHPVGFQGRYFINVDGEEFENT